MDYNITYREKNNGLQAIISYKQGNKWKQKSKQGFENSRMGKKKAKLWADETLQELKNLTCTEINEDYKEITFKEFTTLYMKHLKVSLQQGSYRNYETVLCKFNGLDDICMSSIKPVHIQEIVDNIIKEGKKISTIKDYLGKLNVIFKAAVDEYNIISINPLTKIKVKGTDEKKEIKVLSNKDVDKILKFLGESEFYYITLVAWKSGLRIGEILGLTWDDIDFKTSTISVNKQWKEISKNKYGFGKPKTKNSTRIVPMPSILLKELQRYEKRVLKQYDNRLFSYQNTACVVAELIAKYKKVGYTNTSIHTFRHTYATNLISKNLDFKTTAQLLGHTVGMTMKTYSHVNDEMLLNATKIINKYL